MRVYIHTPEEEGKRGHLKGAWGREKRISAGVSEELEEHRGLGSMLQEQVADTVERAEAVPGFNAEAA